MTYPCETVVQNDRVPLAAKPLLHRPALSNRRYDRTLGAAIALRPGGEPCANRWITQCGASPVRIDRVGRAMDLQERYWVIWMAATGLRIVVTRDGGEGGNTAGKLTGKNSRHPPSIRIACSVDALWVNAEGSLERSDEMIDEADIIDRRVFSTTGIPPSLSVWTNGALRIHGDEVTKVGKMGKPSALLLENGCAPMSMKTQDERSLEFRLIRGRHMHSVIACERSDRESVNSGRSRPRRSGMSATCRGNGSEKMRLWAGLRGSLMRREMEQGRGAERGRKQRDWRGEILFEIRPEWQRECDYRREHA